MSTNTAFEQLEALKKHKKIIEKREVQEDRLEKILNYLENKIIKLETENEMLKNELSKKDQPIKDEKEKLGKDIIHDLLDLSLDTKH